MRSFIELFRIERKPGDVVFAAMFLALALLLAAALPSQAPFVQNTMLVAQPAFWPLVGVSMLVVFGAIHFISSVWSPRIPGRWAEVLFWVRSIEFVGWFLGYVIAVPKFGYLPSTILFVFLLSLRLGYRSAGVLWSGAAFSLAVVLVFKMGLGVGLPAGAIYEYLPDGIRNFAMANL